MRPETAKTGSIAITFLFTVLSFTFARSNSLADAAYIFTHLLDQSKSVSPLALGLNSINLFIAVLSVVLMEVIQHYQGKGSIRSMIGSKPAMIRWAIYCVAILLILNLGVFGGGSFIYIQF